MRQTPVGRVFAMLDAATQYLILTNPYGSDAKESAPEADAASFAVAAGSAMKRGDNSTLPPSLRDMMRNMPKP